MCLGALLGLGLVLVQASANALPDGKVQMVRDLIVRVAADKHEDTITRFGAIVSQGLIDAGVGNGVHYSIVRKTFFFRLGSQLNNQFLLFYQRSSARKRCWIGSVLSAMVLVPSNCYCFLSVSCHVAYR